MGHYRLSPEAQADLADIRDFIGRDNPASALAFLIKMTSCFELLSDRPFLGRSRDELARELQSFVHRKHVAFYQPSGEGIDVVGVLHGRRDLVVLF